MGLPINYLAPELRLNRFLDSDPIRGADFRIPQVESTVKGNGNYAVTPKPFFIQPPEGFYYSLARILILVTANNAISSDEYIASGPLTNGLKLQFARNGIVTDITPIPIKHIYDWGSYAGVDVRPLDTSVQTRSWAIRWSFFKSGRDLTIINSGGVVEQVGVLLNDNLSTLDTHTAFIQGTIGTVSNYQ